MSRPAINSSQDPGKAIASARIALLKGARAEYLPDRLFDLNPVPTMVFDAGSLRMLAANDALVETLGFSREELLRLTISSLLNPGQARARELAALGIFDQRTLHGGWRMMRKDGSAIEGEVVNSAILFNGQPARLAVLTPSAGQSTAPERARENDDEYLRALVGHTSEMITILELDGSIRYSSPSVRDVLGYQPEDLRGQNAFGLIHPDDFSAAHERFLKVIDSTEPDERVRFRFRHQDGSWRTLEGVGTNLIANPRVRGVIVHSRLIGEGSAAANTCLNPQVLSTISREIRTPLHGLMAAAGMLLEAPLGAEQRSQAELIQNCGRTLQGVVDRIVEVLGAYTDSGKPDEKDFYPRSEAEIVHKLMRATAATRQVTVAVEWSPTMPVMVVADPGRFRQLLLNSVSTAVRATSPGGKVVLRAKGQALSPEVDHVPCRFEIATEVSGEGADLVDIPAELASWRMSEELLRQLDGVAEEAEWGADHCRFIFTLPLRPASLRAAAQPSPQPAPAPVVQPRRGRVLIAEDNLVNRVITTRLLERLGHRVEAVVNGRLAVEKCSQSDYDLVLMDCEMPEMDGLEATTRIRAFTGARARQTPIIALTAGATPMDHERCRHAGMNAFLCKPVDKVELAAAVDHWMTQAVPVAC